MIQARDITFNIEYGRFIKPIEDKCGKRVQFAKGTNNEIAKKIRKLAAKYSHYTECDHSSFDAHVTTEMLKLTHTFYQSCHYHNADLRKMSKKTLNNNCRTRDGIKYRIKGTRMSGDVDTSLGNSLINYAILKDAVTRMVGECDIIVNGDDSIIFTNRPLDIRQAEQLLKEYNMESKFKPTETNIHKVEFCRHKYIINNDGIPTMMIDPDRINGIFGMTYKQQRDYLEYLRQVCICNIAINWANPIGRYWKQIYETCWTKPLNFAEIDDFKYIELRTKLTAKKELKKNINISTLELNVSMYIAYNNLDNWLREKYIIIRKIKKIQKITTRHSPRDKIIRINTAMLPYLPVSHIFFVNHNVKTMDVLRL